MKTFILLSGLALLTPPLAAQTVPPAAVQDFSSRVGIEFVATAPDDATDYFDDDPAPWAAPDAVPLATPVRAVVIDPAAVRDLVGDFEFETSRHEVVRVEFVSETEVDVDFGMPARSVTFTRTDSGRWRASG